MDRICVTPVFLFMLMLSLAPACGDNIIDTTGSDGGGGPNNNTDASLVNLVLTTNTTNNAGESVMLSPNFEASVLTYSADVSFRSQRAVVTATATVPTGVTIRIGSTVLASGQSSPPITLDLGATEIAVSVTPTRGESRQYTLTVNRGSDVVQSVYGKASNSDGGDQFATVVAIDGNTLVVGAPREASAATMVNGDQADNTTANSGAVYVFVRNGTQQWTQQAYLKAANSDGEDAFGTSVAISGNTIAVGAPFERSGNPADPTDNTANFGAVYIFERTQSNWSQTAYLKASNLDADDEFGMSIALHGATLVIGAPGEDGDGIGNDADPASNAALNAGAIYIFAHDGTHWAEQIYLKASNTSASDAFGSAVAVHGNTVVASAPGERSAATGIDGDQFDATAPFAGAVYVFTGAGSNWMQEAYVKASNTQGGDSFGLALDIEGDTLVVGTEREDSSLTGINPTPDNNDALDSGAVYVFSRSGQTWAQQAYIKSSNNERQDRFGNAVSVDGDTLIVGARLEDSGTLGVDGPQDDNAASGSGAAYLFLREGTSWSQHAYIKPLNTGEGDEFGAAVAIHDLSMVVGANLERSDADGINGDDANNSAGSAGAIYIFD